MPLRCSSLVLLASFFAVHTIGCSDALVDVGSNADSGGTADDGGAPAHGPPSTFDAPVFATTPGPTLAVAVVGSTVVWSSDFDWLYSMDSSATTPVRWAPFGERVPMFKPTRLVAMDSELFWTGDGNLYAYRVLPGSSGGYQGSVQPAGSRASELLAVNGPLVFMIDDASGSVLRFTRTKGESARIYEGSSRAIALVANADYAYSLTESGTLVVMPRSGGYSTYPVPLGGAKALAADGDGLFLVAAADAQTSGSVLLRFDAALATFTRLHVAPFEPSEVVRIATDGENAYVLGSNDLWKISKSGDVAMPILKYTSSVTDIAVAPDGVYCSVGPINGAGAIVKIAK